MINSIHFILYFQRFRECLYNSDKIRTRSILRSNYKLTSLFLLLLPYDGIVCYNICIYIFERLKQMKPKRKAIVCDMDKPEERELWEFMQKLPHGRFSEGTKAYWLGVLKKAKESEGK